MQPIYLRLQLVKPRRKTKEKKRKSRLSWPLRSLGSLRQSELVFASVLNGLLSRLLILVRQRHCVSPLRSVDSRVICSG